MNAKEEYQKNKLLKKRGRPVSSDKDSDWFITSVSVEKEQWKAVDRFAFMTRRSTMKQAVHDLIAFALGTYEKDPEKFTLTDNQ